MIKHILVPLDGNPACEALLPSLAALTKRLGASLTLLRIIDDSPLRHHPDPGLTQFLQEATDEAAARATTYLERVRERLSETGLCIDIHAAVGSPGPAVVSLARQQDADLIALSRRSVPRPESAALGTVANQVLHTAPIPLLLFPAARTDLLSDPVEVSAIAVPLDGSSQAEESLAVAQGLAEVLHVRVSLLRTIPDLRFGLYDLDAPGLTSQAEHFMETAYQDSRTYLEAQRAALMSKGIATDIAIFQGEPAAHIVKTAGQEPGTLIVMSTYSRSGPRSYALGSVTGKVVRDTTNAVLVIPQEPEAPKEIL